MERRGPHPDATDKSFIDMSFKDMSFKGAIQSCCPYKTLKRALVLRPRTTYSTIQVSNASFLHS
jgi:hypothetical protein